MNNDIIAATNNKGKLTELKSILNPYGFEVKSLADMGITADIEETGKTFEENARIKAREIFNLVDKNAENIASGGFSVIADDSGLEVDALNGEPGIYSARYAEPGKRRLTILEKLKNVPYEKRTARFVCCICYIDENGHERIFQGEVQGHIGFENKGENGFGYDPIFEVKQGVTMAMLTDDEKNQISHRGIALRKLAEELEKTKK
ncbi:MAG: RdgB/HAM1 family non-canonical purine NTP pyrophosphatase [Oscillospiraceae bacterium]|nr:RdgB/HAM1 family non-canonical purine NTP pyrophosphatase [Oscillospiraceae bacterium]